jgi:hypothetical protein
MVSQYPVEEPLRRRAFPHAHLLAAANPSELASVSNMATEQFTHDVFLSHSSRDKRVVCEIAEKLRRDGLQIWFDEWEIQPGDNILAKVEEGLERSRVLVLFMSANGFGSDWAQLESGTFRFRDPLNKERRFIPLRLDESPIKRSLAQFLYINWLAEDRENEYQKLLKSCQRPLDPSVVEEQTTANQLTRVAARHRRANIVLCYSFSPEGKRAVSGDNHHTVRLWDLESGRCLRVMEGHTHTIRSVALSKDHRHALSVAEDKTVRLWDLETGHCLRVLSGHTGKIQTVAWCSEYSLAISGGDDHTLGAEFK